MTDIVKRLRCWRTTGRTVICFEAADEIAYLRKAIANLLEVLDSNKSKVWEIQEVEERVERARAAIALREFDLGMAATRRQ